MRKAVSAIMLTPLLMSTLIWAFDIQPVKASPTTIVVPDDYPTIQEAINNANEKDTVYVRSGKYFEKVFVHRAVSLVGESRETTIVYGNGIGSVMQVNANSVNITGFTIENGKEYGRNGIGLGKRTNCNIFGNNIANNWYGIVLIGSSNINIRANNMENNQHGIAGDGCSDLSITGNNATNNWDGIGIDESKNVSIIGNIVSNNQAFGVVSDFPYDNNHISGNNITKNLYGIHLNFAPDINVTGNSITRNSITYNNYGVDLRYSSNETITGNNIAYNWNGLRFYKSSHNSIYLNNFINNTDHVYSDFSMNVWDEGYPSGGNYWSDYNGTDYHNGPCQNETGSDGIGDTPYIIDENNIDHYPSMNPPRLIGDLNHDLKVDIKDIAIAALAFGSQPGHLKWNPIADITGPEYLTPDGKVDIRDIALIAINFGKTYP